MSQQAQKFNLARVLRMLRYGRPYPGRWLLIVLLTLTLTGASLLAPWPMKLLVDYALGSVQKPQFLERLTQLLPGASSNLGFVGWIAAAGFVLVIVCALLDAWLTMTWIRVGQRMVYNVALELFGKIQRRSLLFHTRNTVGDLLARVTGDSACVYSIVELILLSPARAIIMTIVMLAIMLKMDVTLTLLALAAAPLMAGSVFWLGAPVRMAAKLRREVESRLLTHVQQILSGIPVVQAFAQESREQQRFRAFADAAVGAQKKSILVGQFNGLASGLISTLGTATILLVGVRHVLAGTSTLGNVLVFISYLGILQEQMRLLMGLWTAMQGVSASVDRVREFLDEPCEIMDSPDAISLARARGQISFDSVTFGYERGRPVLQNVSFQIPAGATYAVVGSSGAGKSTLASLVPRFCDPWSGRVLMDGQDLKKLTVRSVRDQVAVVLQEPFLFPLTVADNIAYGTPGASRKDVEAAARAAGADGFIRNLPSGYDTHLGERGNTLSGGERQRLSIARALLKNAPILILDEPTASLDAGTEAEILEALAVLMHGRTTLVIAHRLSTIRRADRIIVLDEGRIAEQGTHQDLLALGGIYAQMHQKQTGRRARALAVETSP